MNGFNFWKFTRPNDMSHGLSSFNETHIHTHIHWVIPFPPYRSTVGMTTKWLRCKEISPILAQSLCQLTLSMDGLPDEPNPHDTREWGAWETISTFSWVITQWWMKRQMNEQMNWEDGWMNEWMGPIMGKWIFLDTLDQMEMVSFPTADTHDLTCLAKPLSHVSISSIYFIKDLPPTS